MHASRFLNRPPRRPQHGGPSAVQAAKRQGTLRVFIFITVALAMSQAVGAEDSRPGKPRNSPGAAQLVRTVVVQPEKLDEVVVGTGTIRANESVELHVETAGKVKRILFGEGTPVKRGELLLEVDDAELRAQLARAEQRRNLAALREQRLRTLKEQGFSNLQDYDTAVTELAVQAAEIAVIQTQLDKTLVRAPFDGVVGLRDVSEGAYVTPSTRIARLQAIEQVKIDFTLPEKYGGRVQVGQSVDFSVAGLVGVGTAEIYALEPQIDETTRTVLARARSPNPMGIFHPGAFARVTWRAAETPDALMLPSVAVISGSGEKSIFVAGKGVAQRRVVVTGMRTAGKVQILDGVKAGDRVIVSGLQSLRPGAAIELVEATP